MPPPYDTNTTTTSLTTDYLPLIKNKIILTTGVTPGGLGAAFVEATASAHPALLILAGRNPAKNQASADKLAAAHPGVQTRTLELDLGSFAAVRRAAEEVNGWGDVPRIDVLVCNGGVMGTPYGLTEDGVESQFGTNHLGHWLFVNLLVGKVLAAESPRVVVVTSDGHRLSPVRWGDVNFDKGETYDKWRGYGQSKTANMLMAISLAEKLGPRKGLQAFSLHPGTVEGTALGVYCDWEKDYPALMAADKVMGNKEGWDTEFNFKPQSRGAATHVYAAFDPNLKEHNGAYLVNCSVGDPLKDTIKPWATSKAEAERLWKLSEELVGQKFSY